LIKDHFMNRPVAPNLFLAAMCGLLLASCAKQAPPVKAESARPVLIQTIKADASQTVFSLPGETRARIETRYAFRLGGKVAQRLVAVGDSIAAGQVLAWLDSQDLAPVVATQVALLDGAKTELKLTIADFNRTKELREKNYVSQAQLDRAQALVDGAQAKLKAATAQLKQAQTSTEFQVLKAEKAGLVISVEAEVGQVVSAGQAIYRVAQSGDRDLYVNVPETSLELAKRTSRWVAIVPAQGSKPIEAVLREISPLADPASRTYPMRLTLVNSAANLPLGLSAVVQPAVSSESAAASYQVPLSALYSKDGKTNVWLVDAAASDPKLGTVRLVSVKTDGFLDDSVRITEGLKSGDKVVVAGANLLVVGQKVKLP
jgi:membrane fusion protein, multidrug efflux system